MMFVTIANHVFFIHAEIINDLFMRLSIITRCSVEIVIICNGVRRALPDNCTEELGHKSCGGFLTEEMHLIIYQFYQISSQVLELFRAGFVIGYFLY